MNIKFLKGINTLEELKVEFKKLARKHHPDLGGSTELMQQLNNEYDYLSNYLSNLAKKHNEAENTKAYKERKYWSYEDQEAAKKYRDIITELLKYEDLIVEICGTWLWVSGETKKHAKELSSFGLRYARQKQMWYLGENKGHRGKPQDMDHIRSKYGSTEYKKDFTPQLN